MYVCLVQATAVVCHGNFTATVKMEDENEILEDGER
jgi:hypothetical protein